MTSDLARIAQDMAPSLEGPWEARMPADDDCEECEGTGRDPDYPDLRCPRCGGHKEPQ